jgi:anti-anti-sigma regulatory factor
MEQNQIFYGLHEATLVLRLVGDIRHTASGSLISSAALDDFVEARLQEGGFSDIVIDLSETEAIDSTHLGLLARTAVFLRETEGRNPTLYTPREKITHLLRSMGFDTVFDLVACTPEDRAEECLPETGERDADHMARVMLKAHQTLAAMNENNAAMFKDVVKVLESQVED